MEAEREEKRLEVEGEMEHELEFRRIGPRRRRRRWNWNGQGLNLKVKKVKGKIGPMAAAEKGRRESPDRQSCLPLWIGKDNLDNYFLCLIDFFIFIFLLRKRDGGAMRRTNPDLIRSCPYLAYAFSG